ncbi:MAG: DHH family phosphoesterase [Candidatus Pacebacteria bacterium]|nr:DHH family phosphoesterase [Candidatus Paceibacterota bacterium]MDD5356866.1 DHH family phosphoesterase [Candidatus Paceibacterota bacterium]
MKPILVTSYVNPDLDGLSCLFAYTEFLKSQGKNVVAGIIGIPHEEARYVFDRFKISYPETFKNTDAFDQVIMLDGSSIAVTENRIKPEQVIEIIDHRQTHELEKFPNAIAQIELVGAAATLVAEKFIANKVEISKESAILLSTGIISNTFNFKATVTTDRDKEAAKWLNAIAKLPENFWRELFEAKSDMTGEKLWEKMDGDFSLKNLYGKRVGMAQLEMIGAEALIQSRLSEILELLHRIKKNEKLDMIFLNAVDLEKGEAFLICDEKDTMRILEDILHVEFKNNIAEKKGFLMRKEITPLFKKALEK